MSLEAVVLAIWNAARAWARRASERRKRDMLTLVFELIAMVPAVAGIVTATVKAYEAAPDTKTKLAAIVTGLEQIIGEIRTVLEGDA